MTSPPRATAGGWPASATPSSGRACAFARPALPKCSTAMANTLSYDSEDTARSQLFDAEFVEYDGLDEEDALVRGFRPARSAAAAGRQRRGPAWPHDPVTRRARLTPACSPRALRRDRPALAGPPAGARPVRYRAHPRQRWPAGADPDAGAVGVTATRSNCAGTGPAPTRSRATAARPRCWSMAHTVTSPPAGIRTRSPPRGYPLELRCCRAAWPAADLRRCRCAGGAGRRDQRPLEAQRRQGLAVRCHACEHGPELRAIVGFRFQVEHVQMKLKLSQEPSDANQRAVIAALEQLDTPSPPSWRSGCAGTANRPPAATERRRFPRRRSRTAAARPHPTPGTRT